jgi:hypothetical protein
LHTGRRTDPLRLAALAWVVASVAWACASTSTEGSQTHSGACGLDSGATCSAPAFGPDAQDGAGSDRLPDINACYVPEVPPSYDMIWRSLIGPFHRASLSSVCAAAEQAGFLKCPMNRADFLQGLPSLCKNVARVRLNRGCGFDRVSITVSGFPQIAYVFDGTTGALVEADVLGVRNGALPCGDGSYFGGTEPPWVRQCTTMETKCSPCVAEPNGCPADLAALLPASPCPPEVTPVLSCDCGAQEGAECGTPSHCATCRANGAVCEDYQCRCFRDGAWRYALERCPGAD